MVPDCNCRKLSLLTPAFFLISPTISIFVANLCEILRSVTRAALPAAENTVPSLVKPEQPSSSASRSPLAIAGERILLLLLEE